MFRKTSRRPASDWKWWQALLASAIGFGVFGTLPGILPPISLAAMRTGWALALAAVGATMWSWWSFNWWARLAYGAIWSLQLLAAALRAWYLMLGLTSMWIAPMLAAYLLAWSTPALSPRLSAILWREQTAPQTRAGRIFLAITLTLGPSAGVIGASFGIFGSRFGNTWTTLLAVAVLASAVSIGFAFAFAYQLWPDRPWANNRPERT